MKGKNQEKTPKPAQPMCRFMFTNLKGALQYQLDDLKSIGPEYCFQENKIRK